MFSFPSLLKCWTSVVRHSPNGLEDFVRKTRDQGKLQVLSTDLDICQKLIFVGVDQGSELDTRDDWLIIRWNIEQMQLKQRVQGQLDLFDHQS